MHNGMQKGGRSWTVVDVTRERSINDSRRFEGYRSRIESKRTSFFFFSFLRNTLDDEILALEREKENGPDPRDDSMITRNERTRPCQ